MIFKHRMQYHARIRMYVFKKFEEVTPRTPFCCCDPEPVPSPSKSWLRACPSPRPHTQPTSIPHLPIFPHPHAPHPFHNLNPNLQLHRYRGNHHSPILEPFYFFNIILFSPVVVHDGVEPVGDREDGRVFKLRPYG